MSDELLEDAIATIIFETVVPVSMSDSWLEGVGEAAEAICGLVGPAQLWRSIDSAPRNGSPVLLKCGLVDRLYIGFNVGDGWIERGSRHVDRPPTHWMPLPSMPNQGAKA